MQKLNAFIISILLIFVLGSCSSFKTKTISAKDLENSLVQNCSHPLIKDAKYGVIPVKVQFIFDNPNVSISKKDNKIYFSYQLKLEALGLNLNCNSCVFSTIPKVVNGKANLSENFTLEKVDCIGGPSWLSSIFSKPQELILNVFSGNPYEIIQCAAKTLPINSDTLYIDDNNELISK